MSNPVYSDIQEMAVHHPLSVIIEALRHVLNDVADEARDPRYRAAAGSMEHAQRLVTEAEDA